MTDQQFVGFHTEVWTERQIHESNYLSNKIGEVVRAVLSRPTHVAAGPIQRVVITPTFRKKKNTCQSEISKNCQSSSTSSAIDSWGEEMSGSIITEQGIHIRFRKDKPPLLS